MPVEDYVAESRIRNSTSYSVATDKECRLSGDILAETLLGNKHARKNLFWRRVKTSIKVANLDTQEAESILNRF